MHPLWAEYDRGTWTDEQVLAAFVKDAPGTGERTASGVREYRWHGNPQSLRYSMVTGTESKGIPCVLSVQLLTQGRDRMCGSVEFSAGDGRWHPVLQGSADQARTGDLPAASETLWLKADESVFLDDTLVNVKAAEEQGIHGIHFLTKEQAEEELRKLGVDC